MKKQCSLDIQPLHTGLSYFGTKNQHDGKKKAPREQDKRSIHD